MTRLEQRIARLERDMRQAASSAETKTPRRLWEWCLSVGAPAPKPTPGETLAEWLGFVPDETLALMTGQFCTRHPMSHPSRADEDRRRRIEARINEES
jgi:hypothetical protein